MMKSAVKHNVSGTSKVESHLSEIEKRKQQIIQDMQDLERRKQEKLREKVATKPFTVPERVIRERTPPPVFKKLPKMQTKSFTEILKEAEIREKKNSEFPIDKRKNEINSNSLSSISIKRKPTHDQQSDSMSDVPYKKPKLYESRNDIREKVVSKPLMSINSVKPPIPSINNKSKISQSSDKNLLQKNGNVAQISSKHNLSSISTQSSNKKPLQSNGNYKTSTSRSSSISDGSDRNSSFQYKSNSSVPKKRDLAQDSTNRKSTINQSASKLCENSSSQFKKPVSETSQKSVAYQNQPQAGKVLHSANQHPSRNSSRGIVSQNSSRGIESQNSSRGIASQNSSRGIASQNSSRGIVSQNSSRGIESQNTSRGIESQNTSREVPARNSSLKISSQNPYRGIASQSSSRGIAAQSSARGIAAQSSARGIAAQSSARGIAAQSSARGIAAQSSARGIAAQSSGRGIFAQAGRATSNYLSGSEDEEDSEMDDFIVDTDDVVDDKIIDIIHKSLNFDPKKYDKVSKYDDCRNMESRFNDIQREETQSARIAREEDNKELQLEELRLKRKAKRI